VCGGGGVASLNVRLLHETMHMCGKLVVWTLESTFSTLGNYFWILERRNLYTGLWNLRPLLFC